MPILFAKEYSLVAKVIKRFIYDNLDNLISFDDMGKSIDCGKKLTEPTIMFRGKNGKNYVYVFVENGTIYYLVRT